MAEGAPLLREYGVTNSIEGSNPSLSARIYWHAPVAQLDRVPGYELGGRRFESFRARQNSIYGQGHIWSFFMRVGRFGPPT